MKFIEWDESYSVGVNEINEQHKKLINIINELYDSMKEGRAKEILSKIFQELVEYTVFHFNSEENYMKMYNYPEYEKHSIEHKYLTEKVKDYENKYKSGAILLSVEVLNFLKDWLFRHILNTDMKYKEFFKEKGLK